jgi:hypothetical protein
LSSHFGKDDAAEILQKLGKFNGIKGVTHGPEVIVFKTAPVRDAQKAAFDINNKHKDDIYGKASIPMMGILGLGGSALLAHQAHKD